MPLASETVVSTPLPELLTWLFRNCVPVEWFELMASFAPETVLLFIAPPPPKLNMPIEAGSAWTFCTVLSWKLNDPPLEAYMPRR